MNFKDKTVVITGGAKGIGAACAQSFYKAGAKVAILDLANGVHDADNERWFFQTCDVSKAGEVEKAIQSVWEKYGAIHYLINNTGIQRYGTVVETSEEEWDWVMNVNLKSYFLCSKYALPFMQQSGGGAVINISSVQAFVTQEKVAAYAASKSAILGLTRSIAIDFAPHIRCVVQSQ
jgi:NAD(P)-dependent dehydrogenase (short-subunit alcohol dehydrogenase family)